MEPDCQWLDEAQFCSGQIRGIYFLRRHSNIFGECSVSLHAESLIEFTGIRTASPAGSASPTIRVRRQGHVHAHSQIWIKAACFDNGGADLMPQNPRIGNQWVLPAEGI